MTAEEWEKRLKAAELLAKGSGCTEIAVTIGIGRQTAYRWRRAYLGGGVDALMAIPPPGRPSELSATQMAELRDAMQRAPAEFDLGAGPWSLKLVSKLIRKRFDVEYRNTNVSRLLLALGAGIKDLR